MRGDASQPKYGAENTIEGNITAEYSSASMENFLDSTNAGAAPHPPAGTFSPYSDGEKGAIHQYFSGT
ncbi:MAG: hypothetical protein EOR97_23895 [Mesorhizobium sp.]|nr:MAG: hypothetical protein EOR97_23895 [Mesorhizobium sp.]